MASDISVVKKTVWQSGLIILTALIISFMVNHFRSEGLPIIGDWTPEGKIAATSGAGLVIDLEKAKELHIQIKALFLDARPDAWYEIGHIQGAKNLPPSQLDELYAKVLGNTPKNQIIVTYCDGESCELSHDLAVALQDKGFNNVHVLVNGWTRWNEAGLPIEEGR